MTRIAFSALCGMLGICLCLGSAAAMAADEDKKPGPEDAVFEMREVSAFDKNDLAHGRPLTRGTSVTCSTEPDKAVKAYPKLNSQKPLYGKLLIDRDKAGGKSIEYHFVLDESGEASPADEKKDEKKEEKKAEAPKPDKSLLQSITDKLTGAVEKEETAKRPPNREVKMSRYDRLYIDMNRDLDLTNDPVVKPMKDQTLLQDSRDSELRERQNFEYLNIDVDYGPGIGIRPFKLLPYFRSYEYDHKTYHVLNFTATVARQGRIKIGKHEYDALLAQPYFISGRFDRPWTALFLKPVDPKDKLNSHGFAGDLLSTMHQVDGEYYMVSSSPLGDKLTVKLYRGDFGVLKIGPGGRDIKNLSIEGSLRSETVEIGFGPDRTKPGEDEKEESEYKVPVGDYLPSCLSIQYGRLWIMLSDNYHSDGKQQNIGRTRNYFIKIRKDQPFVLDFKNKPEVIFTSPAKDKTFKLNDEISVKAVLIDPVCDIMIRRLEDTSKKDDSNKPTNGRSQSLDPLVTITDSAGKKVAEGPMPFG